MNVIDNSHFEVIKNYTNDNPWVMFKMVRLSAVWRLSLIESDGGPVKYIVEDPVFSTAIKRMSEWIYSQRNVNPLSDEFVLKTFDKE